MYLEVSDIVVATFALAITTTLVITTAFKNWKLEEGLKYWRTKYYESVSR